MSTSPSPIAPGSRAAWLLSAASLGAVAGLPWVFILQGPLVSVLFALVAAYRAKQLWQSAERPALSWPLVGATLAAAVALGHPASSTWPDHCFVLNLSNEKGVFVGLLVACGIALAALGCMALVERHLRRRLRRLRALSTAEREAAARLTARWVGHAGIAWSVMNETLFPSLLGILLTFTGSSASGLGPFRDPCNPEVGWVGAALYALSLVMLSRSPRSNTATAAAAAASGLGSSGQLQGALLVALFLAQGARTFVLLHRELPQLREHGGHVDCNCKKYDDTVHL